MGYCRNLLRCLSSELIGFRHAACFVQGMNNTSSFYRRFIFFSVASLLSASMLSDYTFAGKGDEARVKLEASHLAVLKKKIYGQKDFNDPNLLFNQINERAIQSFNTNNFFRKNSFDWSAFGQLPRGIQNQIVSHLRGPALYSCISRNFRNNILDQRSFKVSESIPIQIQLRSYLGPDGKGTLQKIDLSRSRVTNDDLQWISSRFINLNSLDLGNTRISNAGLAHLLPLINLTSLNLFNTQITNVGLPYLGYLKHLTSLNLSNTPISELRHLAPLTNLISLALIHTQVTDQELNYLTPFRNLASLNLFNTPVTDAVIPYLDRIENLTWINLARTHLTESGVSKLPSRLIRFKESLLRIIAEEAEERRNR